MTLSRCAVVLALGTVLVTGCGESPEPTASWVPELPQIHHTHLNTVDAEAAIAWYVRLWPDGEAGSVAGFPAYVADLPVLFTEVDAPPTGGWDSALDRAAPQSPFWHIGGFTNTTGLFEDLEARGFEVLKLRVGPDDQVGAYRSGLTPYAGIRTQAQLDTARAVEPREGGFGYLVGPDGALVEMTGGPRTNPSFSHVHLFHEQPLCAANWYVENLGMALPPRRDPETGDTVQRPPHEDCDSAMRGDAGWPSLELAGTIRAPRGTVRHANGSLSFYPRQCTTERCNDDSPLVPSRGQVLDHVAFAVNDLDQWLAHLTDRSVEIAEGPYDFGDTRAAMIVGPDGLSIELVEVAGNG